jgi:hypothetical protein
MPRMVRVIIWRGAMYCTDTLHESGVVWTLYRNFATGQTDAAVATLEGWFPVTKARSMRNGQMTFAEKLLARQKESAGRAAEAYDEDWSNMAPNVHELLTRVLQDEKKRLEPATLILYAKSGSWHACISHKGLRLKWWGEGGTIKQAVEKLEAACLAEMGQEEQPG